MFILTFLYEYINVIYLLCLCQKYNFIYRDSKQIGGDGSGDWLETSMRELLG